MPIEPVEYIAKNKIDFLSGNIIKYASRHKRKNGAEDVKKIIHYALLVLKLDYGYDEFLIRQTLMHFYPDAELDIEAYNLINEMIMADPLYKRIKEKTTK